MSKQYLQIVNQGRQEVHISDDTREQMVTDYLMSVLARHTHSTLELRPQRYEVVAHIGSYALFRDEKISATYLLLRIHNDDAECFFVTFGAEVSEDDDDSDLPWDIALNMQQATAFQALLGMMVADLPA